MSEYEFVAFQAIDRQLTEEELEFAHSQSTEADITPWSFTNEYHYGDFRGDAEELLRRGYDVHLHDANYGIRRIMLRLPAGLPFPPSVWKQYVDGEVLSWQADKTGPAGILTVSPFLEPGDLEDIWEPEEYLGDLGDVRNALVEGDLRVLFTLWLCGVQGDYESEEIDVPPVPAGLAEASAAQKRLLEFFGVDPLALAAAAVETKAEFPDLQTTRRTAIEQWAAGLAADQARKLLGEFLLGDAAALKAETIARIREQSVALQWPAAPSSYTLEQLWERTEQLRDEENQR